MKNDDHNYAIKVLVAILAFIFLLIYLYAYYCRERLLECSVLVFSFFIGGYMDEDFGPDTLRRIEQKIIQLGEKMGIPRDQALPIAVTDECVRKRNQELEARVKKVADAIDRGNSKPKIDGWRLVREIYDNIGVVLNRVIPKEQK